MPSAYDADAKPSQRVLGLYSLLLLSGREYALADLAEMFSCSKQTVLRMVEQVETFCGVQLMSQFRDGRRVYRLRAPRSRPHVSVTPEEIQQLLLCRDLVVHLLPKGMRQNLYDVIARATVLLPDKDGREQALESFATAKLKGVIDYTPHQKTIETLLRAIRERAICRITYRAAGRSKPGLYRFAPTQLLAYRETLYAQGFKLLPEAEAIEHPMTMAIHRIKDLEPALEPLTITLPDLAESDLFGFPLSEPFRASIRFEPKAADYVRERQWSKDQVVKELEDGRLELSFTAQSEPEVRAWVLGFGAAAEALAPETLRQAVRKSLIETLEKYS